MDPMIPIYGEPTTIIPDTDIDPNEVMSKLCDWIYQLGESGIHIRYLRPWFHNGENCLSLSLGKIVEGEEVALTYDFCFRGRISSEVWNGYRRDLELYSMIETIKNAKKLTDIPKEERGAWSRPTRSS